MKRPRWLLPLLVLACVLVLAGEVGACPLCKQAISAQGDGSGLRQGFFWSILFMMAMPFFLLGAGALMIVRAVKRGGFPEL